MRLGGTRLGTISTGRGLGNQLWDVAGNVPTLDLRFAESKSLTDAASGQSLVTFTRASSGTYVGSNGVLQTATTNEPRFDHNPTTGESLGLLVEEQRTNLLLNSSTLSTQNVTVTAVAHTLSFTGTGTITLSGTSTAGPLVGTGTGEANRVSLTFTPTAGTLTLTVSGTVTNAQLEAGSFRTSYIPTTTATATRSADVASITGANFSSWYRQDEGTVFAEVDRNTAITAATTVVSINDNTTDNRLFNFRQDSASQLTVISQTGGILDASPQVSLTNTSARNKVAAAQALNNLAASANGGTAVADSSVAIPTVNQMQIGNVTNVSVYNGTIRRLTYWPQRLSNQTLQTISGPALPAPAVSDPYFSSVSMLLHMNGSNGSTTFTDSSSNALTVQANGNAQISTAQSKFGGASALFDGSGDYLSFSEISIGASTDVTLECWVYLNSVSDVGIFGTLFSGNWQLLTVIGGKLSAYWNGLTIEEPTASITTSTWSHVAITRASGTLRLFVNGTLRATASSNTNNFTVTRIANTSYRGDLNGYVDDARITVGVARYTANFTPPTAAFPDN